VKLLNPWELILIVFVLVLIFGSKRLPQMGRSMGGAIRGFKDSVSNRIEQQDAEHEQEQAKQQAQIPPAPPVPAQQAQSEPRERDTVV
jgi:sec-independent protein translocase protein TatA